MPPTDRRGSRFGPALAGVCLLALALHVSFGGSSHFAPADLVAALFRPRADDTLTTVMWQVRLPRGLGAGLAGALLAVVGAAFQSLFRNPLAEPYVVGVSSGASAAGALAVVVGLSGGLGLVVSAWLGGLGALALVFGLARPEGSASMGRLLLAGVVVGTMLGAMTVVVLLLGHRDTNQILRWMMGSTSPMFWDRVLLLALALLVGMAVLWRKTRALNTVAMTGRLAETLGVDAKALTRTVLWAGSAMVGVSVGSVGLIGFVGLAAPHVARTLYGPDLRRTLPASAALGATLLLLADVLAIRLLPGVELPVGAVTAVLGAPVLLYLLRGRENYL